MRISIAIGEPIVSPGAHAGQKLDRVALDLHAPPAPVALLAARELDVDVLGEQRQSGGHAFEHADQGRAVRFASGGEAEHCVLVTQMREPDTGSGSRDEADQ